jgi:hypothetical protein
VVLDFRNNLSTSKNVKNGKMIKQGVSEDEFVKMVKSGTVE